MSEQNQRKKMSMATAPHPGDNGFTRLPGGEIIPKGDPRLEAVGALDELVSALGVARASLNDEVLRTDVLRVQKELFLVGAECAAGLERAARLTDRICLAHCETMDAWCIALESRIVLPRDFIVPGETLAAAHVDLARAVARRCERRIAALSTAGHLANPYILRWMNRLSTALWLLARVVEKQSRPLRES